MLMMTDHGLVRKDLDKGLTETLIDYQCSYVDEMAKACKQHNLANILIKIRALKGLMNTNTCVENNQALRDIRLSIIEALPKNDKNKLRGKRNHG